MGLSQKHINWKSNNPPYLIDKTWASVLLEHYARKIDLESFISNELGVPVVFYKGDRPYWSRLQIEHVLIHYVPKRLENFVD